MVGIFDMKRITITLLIGIIFLTACAGTASLPPTATVSVTDNAASTPSSTATATQTPLPSSTPTSSITPLPIIPTFTPTFDARTIVTITSAAKAQCPKENLSLKPNFSFPSSFANIDDITAPILNYLNEGGSPNSTVEALQNIFKNKHRIYFDDVTGDTIPELISDNPYLWVAGCMAGKYEVLYSNLEASEIENIVALRDINSDGIAEIVFYDAAPYAASTVYRILEWDGNNFSDLISNKGDIQVGGSFTEAQLKDIDGNGIEELIIDIGVRGNIESVINGPLRTEHEIFTWNGHNYILSQSEFATPEYRFQAIQDADSEVLNGRFNKAMNLYQESIQLDKLDWWSKDKSEYIKATALGTSMPTPTPDLSEYPRLAAYAYYRIMLLHLVQNHEPEATTVYNTLQKKFDRDPYGHPYVEMATAFWEAYQSTHKMYDGCAAAIQYAAEHPEILTPLGSDYHGSQSHIYVPEDVCPFR